MGHPGTGKKKVKASQTPSSISTKSHWGQLAVMPGLSFQLWALTLSFSCKVWHMEDNTPRGRESISLASVANGLDNRGAELLESLVCRLPHPGLLPTPTWWEGPLFSIFLPPLSPPQLFASTLGNCPSPTPPGF